MGGIFVILVIDLTYIISVPGLVNVGAIVNAEAPRTTSEHHTVP